VDSKNYKAPNFAVLCSLLPLFSPWFKLYLYMYKQHFLSEFTPQNWGAPYKTLFFFSEKLNPLKKTVILQMTEPTTLVLYILKPPVETVSV
jgi:hypothetical protein